MLEAEGRIISVGRALFPDGKVKLIAALQLGAEQRFWPVKSITGITQEEIKAVQNAGEGISVNQLPKVRVGLEDARTIYVSSANLPKLG